MQAIIRGMTPAEQREPEDHQRPRRLRIANGSGVTVSEGQPAGRPVLRRPQDDGADVRAHGFRPPPVAAMRVHGQGQEGRVDGRGPTPPKVRGGFPGNGRHAGYALPDSPIIQHAPAGLNELPPGLEGIDVSQFQQPKKRGN